MMKRFFKTMLQHTPLGLIVLLSLQACNKEDVLPPGSQINLSTPNQYLTFFNQNRKIPAGQYTLVVATAGSGEAGNFSLSFVPGDGAANQIQTGSWTNSAGQSATPEATCSGDPANVCFDIDIQRAGGFTATLTSSLDTVLYLLDDSDTPVIVAQRNEAGAGAAETLEFSSSDVNQLAYANAYYQAVDPANARDTLQKYKTLHGFDGASDVVHVTFRDSKDLGYGRDMYMRSYPNNECGGQVIAFYVQNFSVDIVDGLAYGPVNLAAAINQDLQHHFGTNAIEFSRGLTSVGDTCSAQPYTRFYTFLSDYSSSNAVHPRLLTIDLDSRGEKAMPQPCITCHGGKIKLLDRFDRVVAQHANDDPSQIGDSKARLQAFEVDSFEFAASGPHAETLAQENLRKLNSAVYCSYPGSLSHAACDDFGGGIAAQTDDGEWDGDFAREVLLGWYANQLEVTGTQYDNSFVPQGWTPSAGQIPQGADTLYKKVIAPNCQVCHGKMGNNLAPNQNIPANGMDLDFSSYQKFISYAADIKRLVFEEGRMPLGLLNYTNFWNDPEKADLLATFLAPEIPGFADEHLDSNGDVIPPGKTIARAGLDRVTRSNAKILLNGYASLFADGFEWTVLSQPAGASVSLSTANKGSTDFSADTVGSYQIQLSVNSTENGQKDTDTLDIVIDDSLTKSPRSLAFYPDISSIVTTSCTTCHAINGGTEAAVGVPVWWVDDASQPQGIPATIANTPSLGLYEQVRSRVNFDHIEISKILTKPSGLHHYGNQRIGFDIAAAPGTSLRSNYDLLVNWISEGAVCGGTSTQCP